MSAVLVIAGLALAVVLYRYLKPQPKPYQGILEFGYQIPGVNPLITSASQLSLPTDTATPIPKPAQVYPNSFTHDGLFDPTKPTDSRDDRQPCRKKVIFAQLSTSLEATTTASGELEYETVHRWNAVTTDLVSRVSEFTSQTWLASPARFAAATRHIIAASRKDGEKEPEYNFPDSDDEFAVLDFPYLPDSSFLDRFRLLGQESRFRLVIPLSDPPAPLEPEKAALEPLPKPDHRKRARNRAAKPKTEPSPPPPRLAALNHKPIEWGDVHSYVYFGNTPVRARIVMPAPDPNGAVANLLACLSIADSGLVLPFARPTVRLLQYTLGLSNRLAVFIVTEDDIKLTGSAIDAAGTALETADFH